MKYVARFARSKDGATAIEYALIAGLVSIAIVAAMGTVGTGLTTLYGSVSQSVTQAASQ